jgi:N4-gp56 family major capsid protein
MMHWDGAGAQVTAETTKFRNNGTNFNVYPMLVVGSGAFTTIGFQTDGKGVKFKTKHISPEQNYSVMDPFGTKGIYSIQWYYGSMVLRPEHIGIMYSLAEW